MTRNPNMADLDQDGLNFFRGVLVALAIMVPFWALLIWRWTR
jgi:hypothetical protein